jgi:TonB-linked SusC/RagA family outer membrane protein
MPLRRVLSFLAFALIASPAIGVAQNTGIIRGRVSDAATGAPLAGVQVRVEGTTVGAQTGSDGGYTITGAPAGSRVLSTRRLGYAPRRAGVTVPESGDATQDFALEKVATTLNDVVVTALGQTTQQRSLGTAQQSVRGEEIAQTQRENFVNALQGRIAGVEVTSSSGVPGSSSMITIRGISSISSSNQPLFIVDGLPMDNKTMNTQSLPSDFPGSAIGFANRGIDFTNRAADINPEDIESLVVLKGPEASALYGIDAANGAIVITTKRGRSGAGGLEYNNNFRVESTRGQPEVQRKYGISGVGSAATRTFLYFGAPYPDSTTFYDNIDGFFRNALTQKHNLSFSGAAQDGRINYRIASAVTRQEGVVPNSQFDRYNLTGSSGAQVNSWLKTDISLAYSYANNDQPLKGSDGPLIGLLVWPQTDNARDYLTATGVRRTLTTLAASAEIDNPWFSINRNKVNAKTNRIIANVGLVFTPFAWGDIRTNIGTDSYTNQNQILRHPESAVGFTANGILDQADDITRSLNAQTLLNLNSHAITRRLSITGLLGQSVSDYKSTTDGLLGQNFLDPNFISVNNALLRSSRTVISQRRLLSLFGSTTLDLNKYLYLTVTGRNDWTSTIPKERNSFFYPSVSSSFIFSDAFPSIGRFMTGKLRAAYAEVGKDARPYAYNTFLETKFTSYGGYGYSFWGPNPNLAPEFARSYEIGTELGFLDNRLGIDATFYRKQTKDAILNDVRSSYATGFILLNLNGAVTRNQGVEVTVRGTPIQRERFSWDAIMNFESSRGKVLALPGQIPESYISDTWLFGNVRNGTTPGSSTRALTGLFYLRNNQGEILIDPTTGLPIRSTDFFNAGYDRQPDYTIGLTNTLRRGRMSLSFLLDIRKGGDVFNATEHYLTARGLATSTLDRDQPRVIKGVLRDGKENTANPTVNTIVIVPAIQTGYYTNMSEELFIEKNINWLRLRDVTFSFPLPGRFGTNASGFVTATDLFLLTNYTGMDPVVNGNTAAVGGSSAQGIDFGNFPMPRGVNFGIRTTF